MKTVERIGRIDCSGDKNITQQSAAAECDINMIVEKAKRGADITPSLTTRPPMYGDFTNLPDYREALNVVVKARNLFNSMDAFVRERFANDPARMLDFLNNPANREEAVKLGLVNPPPVPEPPQAPKGSSGKKMTAEELKKAKPSGSDEE